MPHRTVIIREFQYPQDYDQAARLWKKLDQAVNFGRSDTPQEIEKKMERDPDLFLVAEADGVLVGTVIGGFDGRRGMVYHLAVAPTYRRYGIARRLMNELEKRLAAKGCIRCFLLVHADNAEARAFYKEINWFLLAEDVVYSKDLV